MTCCSKCCVPIAVLICCVRCCAPNAIVLCCGMYCAPIGVLLCRSSCCASVSVVLCFGMWCAPNGMLLLRVRDCAPIAVVLCGGMLCDPTAFWLGWSGTCCNPLPTRFFFSGSWVPLSAWPGCWDPLDSWFSCSTFWDLLPAGFFLKWCWLTLEAWLWVLVAAALHCCKGCCKPPAVLLCCVTWCVPIEGGKFIERGSTGPSAMFSWKTGWKTSRFLLWRSKKKKPRYCQQTTHPVPYVSRNK
jgi:hypothetical protein